MGISPAEILIRGRGNTRNRKHHQRRLVKTIECQYINWQFHVNISIDNFSLLIVHALFEYMSLTWSWYSYKRPYITIEKEYVLLFLEKLWITSLSNVLNNNYKLYAHFLYTIDTFFPYPWEVINLQEESTLSVSASFK